MSQQVDRAVGGRNGSRIKDNSVIVGVIVFLFAFALYSTSLLTVDYRSEDDVFFGADHSHYVAKLEKTGIQVGRNKRPLFGLIVGSAFVILVNALHLPTIFTLSLIFGLLGSLAVGLMFIILQRFFCSPLNAALVSCCYALAFSNVVIFGIPESYSFSVIFVLLVILIILESNARTVIGPGIVGLAGGIAGWTNPVAVFPVGAYALLTLGTRPSLLSLRKAIIACAVGLVIAFMPLLFSIYTKGLDWWERKSGGEYGSSVHNLSDWGLILNTLTSFFVFAVVSPYNVVLHYYTASDLSGYLADYMRLTAVVAWIIVFFFTLYSIFRRNDEIAIFAAALLAALILLIGFYIYFYSRECMLYTPFGLAALFLLLGMAIKHSKVGPPLLVVFMVFLALSNVAPLYNTKIPSAPAQQGTVR